MISYGHLDDAETCCTAAERCRACRATYDKVRAARRDAVLMRIATVRPRRSLR